MRAVLWTRYGPPDVLRIGEVETPSPRDDEVLIRVRAAAVTAGDCEVRRLDLPFWIRWPMRAYLGVGRPSRIRILGTYLAGEIEAVGRNVTRFAVGDQVFAATGFGLGAYAEYRCLPEGGVIAAMPRNTTFEEAAAVPLGGLNALHFLGKAAIRAGEQVLINGAAGSIGTFAVQLAKHYGAEVTAVDAGAKLDALRALGADHVIDYTREDFSRSGKTYHVILDVVAERAFTRCWRALAPGGRYLMANPRISTMIRGAWLSRTSGKRVVIQAANETSAGLVALGDLIEAGALTAVVDRRYPLEQAAEAHRYVESGRKVGDVVLVP